jgi:hypothetical protein
MELVALLHHFRLADKPGTRGLTCEFCGLSLAGVPLLEKSAAGFAPRPANEIGAIILAAYGEIVDPGRLSRGLRAPRPR